MANQYPTASVSISFVVSTVDEDAVFIAEINAEDNGGRTSFPFGGASPKFRIYKSSEIKSVHSFTSDGSTSRVSSNLSETLTEFLSWAGGASADSDGNEDESYRNASVQKPVIGNYTISNIKGNIGSVSLVEQEKTTFQCSKISNGPLDPVVGFCMVTYGTRYDLYQLNNVSKPAGFGQDAFTDYQVLVYLVGVTG